MGLENIAAIQARITEITGRLAPNGTGGRLGTGSSPDASLTAQSGRAPSFASALAQAQSLDPKAIPDDGTLNKAGVNPTKWAIDFLTKLGKPSMAGDMLWPLLSMLVAFTLYFVAVLLVRLRAEILRRERDAGWLKGELAR